MGILRSGGAFCTVRPSSLDVQRGLCTVKPALLDVQRILCTVSPSRLDVQRALCTVKPILLDVQRALCTSASRWGANLYTYIGPMALKSSILTTWAAWRRTGSKLFPNRLLIACAHSAGPKQSKQGKLE